MPETFALLTVEVSEPKIERRKRNAKLSAVSELIAGIEGDGNKQFLYNVPANIDNEGVVVYLANIIGLDVTLFIKILEELKNVSLNRAIEALTCYEKENPKISQAIFTLIDFRKKHIRDSYNQLLPPIIDGIAYQDAKMTENFSDLRYRVVRDVSNDFWEINRFNPEIMKRLKRNAPVSKASNDNLFITLKAADLTRKDLAMVANPIVLESIMIDLRNDIVRLIGADLQVAGREGDSVPKQSTYCGKIELTPVEEKRERGVGVFAMYEPGKKHKTYFESSQRIIHRSIFWILNNDLHQAICVSLSDKDIHGFEEPKAMTVQVFDRVQCDELGAAIQPAGDALHFSKRSELFEFLGIREKGGQVDNTEGFLEKMAKK